MRWSGSGDVAAFVQAVDAAAPWEGDSTSGCEASDFTGFLPGNIALMRQGACNFSVKAQNAVTAGAVGAIIFLLNPESRGMLGSPGITIPVVAVFFNDLYDLTQAGHVVMRMSVTPRVVGPAKIWIGVKCGDRKPARACENSAAVGLPVDVRTEVFDEGGLLATGFLDNQTTGGGGFDNALLKTIALTFGDASENLYESAIATISVRRSCSGSGHKSGSVRLWYNGQPIDTGPTRDAGSRFDARLFSRLSGDYFLREDLLLEPTPGSSRRFAEASVDRRFPCPGRPYKELGTWSLPTPSPGGGTLKPVPR